MPTVIIKKPDGTQQEREWMGQLTIGGATGNDVILPGSGLSPRHVRLLEVAGGLVEIEDNGSVEGTFLDGQRITSRMALRPGAQVGMGRVQIWLRPAMPSAAAGGHTHVSPAPVRPPPPPARPPGLAPASPPVLSPGAPPGLSPAGPPVLSPSMPPNLPPAPPPDDQTTVSPPSLGGAAASPRPPPPPAPAEPAPPASAAPGANGGRPTRGMERVRPSPRSDLERPRPRPAASGRPASAGKGPFALLGLEGPAANRRFPLRGKMSVGRQEGTEITVDDDSVSRRHAELEIQDGKVVLRDLGSANGTTVNGEPITGEVPLQPGDVVGFGVVDFQLEGPPGDALARGGPAGLARPGDSPRRGGAAVPPAQTSSRRPLILGGGALGLILLTVALVKIFSPPVRPADMPLGGSRATEDQPQTLDQLVSRCRSYADPEGGGEPNWATARRFCERAREQDPINEEASELLKRIDRELVSKDIYDKGKKSLERDREEDAIDWFKKLVPQSWYFSPARMRVDDIRKNLVKRLSADCRRYVQNGLHPQAIPRCERYMELVCQDMPPEEFRPAADTRINLTNQKLNQGEWRPSDPAYLDFLRARAKVTPKAGNWECPANDMLKSVLAPEGTGPELDEQLRTRYPEAVLRRAVLLYWRGKHGDSETALFKIRDDLRQAKLHQQADTLRKDLDVVDQLYKAGESELQVEDPESAAEPFREALEADEKVMGSETTKLNPSWYRKGIQLDMAVASYSKGKTWADRGDRRKACKLWKLGWSFYMGYPELSRAIQACTAWANLASAMPTCAEVEELLDYAVEGDGFKEKAEARKQELKCF